MSKLASKKVLAATVAGLAVAGGGAAIAASQTDSPASSFFDSVAKHLGISSEELEDATKAAAVDQVNQALEDGRITEEPRERLLFVFRDRDRRIETATWRRPHNDGNHARADRDSGLWDTTSRSTCPNASSGTTTG